MALAPASQPIGIFPQFIAQQPETIVLKEKVMSFSGDSFHIKLANGTPIFQVEGKVMSISGRKIVRDMAGNHLFDICKELFHLHTTFVIMDPSDNKIMEVRSNINMFGSKAIATFTSTNGKPEELTLKGDFFDTVADITDNTQGGKVVARIDRKMLSGKDIFFDKETYSVQVAPGVDMALVAAMCICLDEKNNESG